ncbi:hypothetical protein PPERSA_07123 [Pseudocohnilembus persalinus]|uniref:LysM domain-containing protein n=1 Tax=Pseudocohnilembus persalinus TaxID=266149 RepID=A0A0V0QY37_PSEPJ|nr:hypothetical protein PPERSA_07123 [Pseudocohnilembus persalinus]|eukprot:KRX06960.1 hypothetical protein PPERSA_07123 [Pseudocohnilembus persalinus]
MNTENIVPGYQYHKLEVNDPSEEVVQGQNIQFNKYSVNPNNGQYSQQNYNINNQEVQQNQNTNYDQPLQGLTLEQYQQLQQHQYFNNQQNNQMNMAHIKQNNNIQYQQQISDENVQKQQQQNDSIYQQKQIQGSLYPTFGDSQVKNTNNLNKNDENNNNQNNNNIDNQIKAGNNNSSEQQVKLYYDPVRNCNYIVHKILPSDTLIGLSIRYDVSEHKIKMFNDLDGEEIWFKKTLNIPNPQTNVVGDSNQDLEEVIKQQQISQFKFHVLDEKDKSEKMAKFYLEDHNWDIQMAAKAYREDVEWEKQQQKQAQQLKYNKYKKIK